MEVFLGARPYDFKDEDTGRQITGVTVHFCDNENNDVTGYLPTKVSMKNEDFDRVFGGLNGCQQFVMKPVAVSYNKRGKPEAIELVTAK